MKGFENGGNLNWSEASPKSALDMVLKKQKKGKANG